MSNIDPRDVQGNKMWKAHDKAIGPLRGSEGERTKVWKRSRMLELVEDAGEVVPNQPPATSSELFRQTRDGLDAASLLNTPK